MVPFIEEEILLQIQALEEERASLEEEEYLTEEEEDLIEEPEFNINTPKIQEEDKTLVLSR